jgi:transcriptional regulator with XRE-family HTH domain
MGRPADRDTERKPALVTAIEVLLSIFSDVVIDIYGFTHHIWCVMKIAKQATDRAVLAELGERLTRIRLERNLTQVQLAGEAGVAKSTVQRLEAGVVATQLSGFIRVCRVLDLIERFNLLIPEPVPSPVAQLKLAGRKRQRASTAKPAKVSGKKWQWGNEQ